MTKKFTIQVREYKLNDNSFEIKETIQRVLRSEQIGNFNPIFCTHKGNKRILVHSEAGDLSDPFRRSKEYADTLFIKLKKES